MTTTLQDLKPSQVNPHKHNVRRDVGDVTELAASIRDKGIVEPLIVAPTGTGKFETYTLIAGHRRLAAAKVAKLKAVPCLVRDDLVDEQAQLEVMLVENLQRTDLSPVEEAEAYQQLLTFPGYTQKRLAEATGRTAGTIRSRLKMAKLPPSALAKIHEGQLTLTSAEALSEFVDDVETVEELLQALNEDPIDFAYALENAQDERRAEKQRAKAVADLEKAGVRIITNSWSTKHRYLHGDDAVTAHRECEGFCAQVRHAGAVTYVCDRPDLHKQADGSVDTSSPAAEPGDVDQQDASPVDVAGTARDGLDEESDTQRANRENRELETHLRELTRDRQVRLGNLVLETATLEFAHTLLVDQVMSSHSRNGSLPTMLQMNNLASQLQRDGADITADDIRAQLTKLDVPQLVFLLDILDNSNNSLLDHAYGWGLGDGADYGVEWRTRLTDVYGLAWSPAEQELLDRVASARAAELGDDEDTAAAS